MGSKAQARPSGPPSRRAAEDASMKALSDFQRNNARTGRDMIREPGIPPSIMYPPPVPTPPPGLMREVSKPPVFGFTGSRGPVPVYRGPQFNNRQIPMTSRPMPMDLIPQGYSGIMMAPNLNPFYQTLNELSSLYNYYSGGEIQ